MSSYQSRLKQGLPKNTTSLCPECKKVIGANIFERNDAVWMSKECPDHGLFEDIYWSDVDMYLKAERYSYDGKGVQNNHTIESNCPFDCGLCSRKDGRAVSRAFNADIYGMAIDKASMGHYLRPIDRGYNILRG